MARNPNPPEPRLVRLKTAAEYADLSVVTLRRRISDGTLPAFRKGLKIIEVDLNDVDRLRQRIPTTSSGAA